MERIKITKSYITCSSLKKCWNFNAVFQRNSAGIPEVNILNHSGILMEFHWNTIGILPSILYKFTACFSELFRIKYHSFFGGENRNSYGIFVVFSRIWEVFWWDFSGLLMKSQSKKQCKRSYLQNLTSFFAEFFIYFLILLYPKREWKKPCTIGT